MRLSGTIHMAATATYSAKDNDGSQKAMAMASVYR